ncbi:MAG: ABC transporter ATP-binding protein/permease [Clostridia bacterium]|nr:ABC transporter ATP-binding protein/permease [Clostridia bacterium]
MLQLKNIKKDYPAGGETVAALRGIDLTFRDSEFVSILGPSGCGKTTMLNIIGGLDQYTSGDLQIHGVSTKDFKDRDWDAYRNHSIGFVFQSYNLIPHQSVLQNVELALTLSGVSKAERRQRAKKALKEVGLSSQMYKKPGEMSGGQMQRVAIARAIVNNPDIILADEPTGALDTETSVQVMEILKEISKDRLIIMVTHNPDLAERYSTRIIRMLDGVITDDSMPLTEAEIAAAQKTDETKREAEKGKKKPSMSFATSFGLSLKNLFTKKGRTTLTSFAGSIGIIGIALIYAVSQGMTMYIDAVQEDTLSSYPLTLEAQSIEIGSLMEMFMGTAESGHEHELDAVYQKSMLYDMVNAMSSLETTDNDLRAFKVYLEKECADPESKIYPALNGIQYSYDTELLVYTKNVDGTIIHSDTEALMQEILIENLGLDLSGVISAQESSTLTGGMSMMSMSPMSNLWQEILPGENGKPVNELLENQYDVIYGRWPSAYNEIVLVVDEQNELDDMTLYALGLKSKEQIDKLADAAINQGTVEISAESWTFKEICALQFRTVLPADVYTLDEHSGLYTDLRESGAGMKYLYDNGIDLKVTGIIRKSEDAVSTMLTGTIAYTSALTEYIITNSADSPAIQAQLSTPDTDIFTGLPFRENAGTLTDAEKETEFRRYIDSLTEAQRAEAYIRIMSIPAEEQVNAAVSQAVGAMTRAEMEAVMTEAFSQQMGMSTDEIGKYMQSFSDEDMTELFAQMAEEQFRMQYAAGVEEKLSTMTAAQLAGALQMSLPAYTTEQCAAYYEEILVFSDSTYENNLRTMGHVSLDDPSAIHLYASSFENKDVLEECIKAYNDTVDELYRITYTDYVGIMMSSITTIINAITYVLIAFVAVSLIVSSIMIGVITLISVQERTKEIGILRAIGASKKNVSGMFNAETMIIGFTSGVLGVLITYLLCIPINMILHYLTGIANLSAYLPLPVAVVLVLISMLLTLIAGIIPSRSAAKKDPVVALRTE